MLTSVGKEYAIAQSVVTVRIERVCLHNKEKPTADLFQTTRAFEAQAAGLFQGCTSDFWGQAGAWALGPFHPAGSWSPSRELNLHFLWDLGYCSNHQSILSPIQSPHWSKLGLHRAAGTHSESLSRWMLQHLKFLNQEWRIFYNILLVNMYRLRSHTYMYITLIGILHMVFIYIA